MQEDISENLTDYLEWVYNECAQPLFTCVTDIWYYLYSHTTLFNLAVIFLKYIPTCLYMYKFTKSVYTTSMERLKVKQMELEEIELQIQIVDTKISVRDSECEERLQGLRRGIDELRRIRARVREVIAVDSSLLRLINAPYTDDVQNFVNYCTPEQENDILMDLFKEMKVEKMEPEKGSDPMNDYNKSDAADSIYSSVSDNEAKKDCRLKIIKVTNVYKVAYLKNFIKQKRLRRANRQAQLKKKVESIKQLLEDWHETLNIVINSKLTLLNLDPHPIDVQSQEAMGDFSKAIDDFDGEDIQNCSSDTFLDEYNTSWTSTCNSSHSYDDMIERNCSQEYGDTNCCHPLYYEGNNNKSSNMLSILPEETSSQIAIEESKNEADEEYVCHNLIDL